MTLMKPFLVLALFSLGCSDTPGAEDGEGAVQASADPLEGAWTRLETVSTSDQTIVNNQPGLRLFVDGHFSFVAVNGTEPRALQLDSMSTVADLRAVWGDAFTAGSGTYEVAGDTVITRSMVAKDPAGMESAQFTKATYRIVGDTLWHSSVVTQDGPVANPQTGKFLRVR